MRLKDETAGNNQVCIHHIIGTPLKTLRKMTEAIFHNSPTAVYIYTTLTLKTILDDEPLSDHALIYYELKGKAKRKTGHCLRLGSVQRNHGLAAARHGACRLPRVIHRGATGSLPEQHLVKGQEQQNQQITSKRCQCNQMRRNVSRAVSRRNIPEEEKAQLINNYKTEKRTLQKLIKTSKR
ncbi:hypothetical protein JTB14_009966 [Gonioctena quinquepunctata]|nr:hypothetical protein JTB14_009966 [Gonioctena quinquepunctata]